MNNLVTSKMKVLISQMQMLISALVRPDGEKLRLKSILVSIK
jgi:hypothetical protein